MTVHVCCMLDSTYMYMYMFYCFLHFTCIMQELVANGRIIADNNEISD